MKKFVFFITVIIVAVSAVALYLGNFSYLTKLDNQIRDTYFKIRGPIKTTNSVVIVDIDEKSLSELGQWPWRRDKIAKILKNLTNAGAGIIGLDMFFPEKDGKSPSNILHTKKALDSDEVFGMALRNSPSIMGYLFDFDRPIKKGILPNVPAYFVQKNLKKEYLLQAKGYIANIPVLQKNAYSGGFVNMIPDIDGVVRYVPLVIKYKGFIYPSLAFEMFRIASGVNKVVINYSDAGIDSIQLKNYKIPTDRFGRIFINYRGDAKTFPYISASDVYNNTFDKNLVKHKFVLIGTSAVGLFDLRVTPFNNVFPGVEVHANIIDNLLKGDFIFKPDFAEALDILIIITTALAVGVFIYFFSPVFSFVSVSALAFSFLYGTYYVLFHYGYIINLIIPLLVIIVLSLVLYTVNYLFESREARKLKKAFAKKVSPKVLDELVKNSNKKILEPRNKEVSVFFSDVRGFTSISEKLEDPKKVIEMLNIYMTPMVDIIVSYEGTIDKFIGDAIMAYWNAPVDVKEHADKCVTSALKQVEKLKELNKTIKEKFDLEIDIGIGINTGEVTIGEMGSEGRADYTIIGDNVNLASRLEGLNKIYKTHIIISEFTKNLLKKDYIIREIDLVRVKGKHKPIKIYEVIGFGKGEFEEYMSALKLYRNAEFEKAKNLFVKLYNQSGDYLYELYIKRCDYLINNPPENFDGVYTLTTK